MKRWPAHYYFCTYFDQNYLARGLLLYKSLMENVPSFTLYVLALDDVTYDILTAKSLSNIVPVHLLDLEKYDEELLATKSTRSMIEYYFTCSPCFPLYVLAKNPDIDILTYLDADIYFYDSPRLFYEELGDNSVLVFEHGISPLQEERFGRFNVGYLSWRNDETGLACLRWWRARCIEWCYDRVENGKFADQKYLDQWPILFKSTKISGQTDKALAPWNLGRYRLKYNKNKPQNLILFHFHSLRILTHWCYTISGSNNIFANDIANLFNAYVKQLISVYKSNSLALNCGMRPRSLPRKYAVGVVTVPLLSRLIWNATKYLAESDSQGERFIKAYQERAVENPVREAVQMVLRFPALAFNRHVMIGIIFKNLLRRSAA